MRKGSEVGGGGGKEGGREGSEEEVKGERGEGRGGGGRMNTNRKVANPTCTGRSEMPE